ncbi:MAG: hypothetical protein JWN04_4764 [Myxococcaceae bacterium]|nr:hypothetical protein [Myxococcaceae bacterium]
MARRLPRASLAVLLGALLGLLGPCASVWADDVRTDRAQGRSTRSKKRPRSSSSHKSPDVSDEAAEESESSASDDDGAAGQADEEVISDPELRNAPPTPTSKRSDGEDEVISDPELDEGPPRRASQVPSAVAGWGELDKSTDEPRARPRPRDDEHDPLANTGTSRLVAFGQFGSDIHHEGDLEDAYETRLRFDAEVEFRRSKKVRLSIGVRTDLLWALPARGDCALRHGGTCAHPVTTDTALSQGRFELDILPLSAYVDVTPKSGFHMRIGDQQVSMARMDFYSAVDMLAAFDMRGQIGLGQSTGKLAQPAVRVDWDLSSWATLQMVYLPWFMPNLVRPNRDRFVSRELGTSGAALPANIDHLIAPGNQTKANGDFIRFVGPQPDFTKPQGQARLNMRGHGFELAVTGGSALEKLPSIYATPELEKYVRGSGDSQVFVDLQNGKSVVDVAYHRYEQIGIDGTIDIAPLNVGFELAFSPSRHLVAATAAHLPQVTQTLYLPQPNVSRQIVDPTEKDPSNVTNKSIRKGVPLLQGALHVDWLKGETFAVAIEGFFVQALKLPYDTTRDWWGFVPKTGLYAGGILGGTYRPDPNGRWRFDGSLVGLIGPSVIFMPQIEYKALDTLFINVGAQFFEGPIPMATGSDGKSDPISGGVQSLNVGGLFCGYDQVYVGFRYVP